VVGIKRKVGKKHDRRREQKTPAKPVEKFAISVGPDQTGKVMSGGKKGSDDQTNPEPSELIRLSGWKF
jgi:hypothetical protein